jgi:hypothetical protein
MARARLGRRPLTDTRLRLGSHHDKKKPEVSFGAFSVARGAQLYVDSSRGSARGAGALCTG